MAILAIWVNRTLLFVQISCSEVKVQRHTSKCTAQLPIERNFTLFKINISLSLFSVIELNNIGPCAFEAKSKLNLKPMR